MAWKENRAKEGKGRNTREESGRESRRGRKREKKIKKEKRGKKEIRKNRTGFKGKIRHSGTDPQFMHTYQILSRSVYSVTLQGHKPQMLLPFQLQNPVVAPV